MFESCPVGSGVTVGEGLVSFLSHRPLSLSCSLLGGSRGSGLVEGVLGPDSAATRAAEGAESRGGAGVSRRATGRWRVDATCVIVVLLRFPVRRSPVRHRRVPTTAAAASRPTRGASAEMKGPDKVVGRVLLASSSSSATGAVVRRARPVLPSSAAAEAGKTLHGDGPEGPGPTPRRRWGEVPGAQREEESGTLGAPGPRPEYLRPSRALS